jgi:hypothetical protein
MVEEELRIPGLTQEIEGALKEQERESLASPVGHDVFESLQEYPRDLDSEGLTDLLVQVHDRFDQAIDRLDPGDKESRQKINLDRKAILAALRKITQGQEQAEFVEAELAKAEERPKEREELKREPMGLSQALRTGDPEIIMEAHHRALVELEIKGTPVGGIERSRLISGEAGIPQIIGKLREDLERETNPVVQRSLQEKIDRYQAHMQMTRARVTMLDMRRNWDEVARSVVVALQNASTLDNAAMITFWHDSEIVAMSQDPSVLDVDVSNEALPWKMRIAHFLRRFTLLSATKDLNAPLKEHLVFDERGILKEVIYTYVLSEAKKDEIKARGWTHEERVQPVAVIAAEPPKEVGRLKLDNAARKFNMLPNATVQSKPETFQHAPTLFFERDSKGNIIRDFSRTVTQASVFHNPMLWGFWARHFFVIGNDADETNKHNWYELLRDPQQIWEGREGMLVRTLAEELRNKEAWMTDLRKRQREHRGLTEWERGELQRLQGLEAEKEGIDQIIAQLKQLYARDGNLNALFTAENKVLREEVARRMMTNLNRWTVDRNPYASTTVLMPCFDLDRRDDQGRLIVDLTKLDFGPEFESDVEFWREVETRTSRVLGKETYDAREALDSARQKIQEMIEAGERPRRLVAELDQFWRDWRGQVVNRHLEEVTKEWQELREAVVEVGAEVNFYHQVVRQGAEIEGRITQGDLKVQWGEFVNRLEQARPEEIEEIVNSWVELKEELERAGVEEDQLNDFDQTFVSLSTARVIRRGLDRVWGLFSRAMRQKDDEVVQDQLFNLMGDLGQRIDLLADEELVARWEQMRATFRARLVTMDVMDESFGEVKTLIAEKNPEATERFETFGGWVEESITRLVGTLRQVIDEVAEERGRETSTGWRITAWFEFYDALNDREKTASWLRVATSELPGFKEIWEALRGKERIYDEVARFYPERIQEFIDRLLGVLSVPHFNNTLAPERRVATPQWVAEKVENPIILGLFRQFYRRTMFGAAGIEKKDWTSVPQVGLTANERLRLLLHMSGLNTTMTVEGETVEVKQKDLWDAFFRRAGLDITYESLLAYVGWKPDNDGLLSVDKGREWGTDKIDSETAERIDRLLAHKFFRISYDYQVDNIVDTLVDVYLGELTREGVDYESWMGRGRTGKRWIPLFDPWEREKLFLTLREEFRYGIGPEDIRGRRILDKKIMARDNEGNLVERVVERGLDRVRSLMHGTGALAPGSPAEIKPMFRYMNPVRFLYSEMARMSVSFWQQAAEEKGMEWERLRYYFMVMKPETVHKYMDQLQLRLAKAAPEMFMVWKTVFGGTEKKQAKDFEERRKSLKCLDVRETEELTRAAEQGASAMAAALQAMHLPGPARSLPLLSRVWNWAEAKYLAGWGLASYTIVSLVAGKGLLAPVLTKEGAVAAGIALLVASLARDKGDDPRGFLAGPRGWMNETIIQLPEKWVQTKFAANDKIRRLLLGFKFPTGLRGERILRRRPDVMKEGYQWFIGSLFPQGPLKELFTIDGCWDDLLDQTWLEMFAKFAEGSRSYLARGIEPFFEEQIPYEVKAREIPQYVEFGERWTRRQFLAWVGSYGRKGALLYLGWKYRNLIRFAQRITGTTPEQQEEELELNRLTYMSVDILVDPAKFQREIERLKDYSRDYQRLSGGISNSANWEVIPEGKRRGVRGGLEIYEGLTRGVLTGDGRAEILSNVPAEQRFFRKEVENALDQLNEYQLRSGLQRLDEPAFYGFLREQGYSQHQIDVWQAMVEAYRTNNGERLAELLAEEKG